MKKKKVAATRRTLAPATRKKASRHVKRQVQKAVRRKLPVHRRVLIHPATIFTLLCVGVLIAGWTRLSNADSISVTAVVPAPLLSQGADITSPSDGDSESVTPITVKGTCPLNSYIKLTRNGILSGSAFCLSDQTFSIVTTLSPGVNVLSAQDYNITDQPGPVTSPVKVTYDVPVPPVAPPSTIKELERVATKVITSPDYVPRASSLPLLLTTNYSFKTFVTGSEFSWPLDLEGGTTPYYLQADWGDGEHSVLVLKTDPIFNITHTYQKSGYYPVKIHVTDAAGRQTDLQIAALIRKPGVGFGVGGTNPANPTTRTADTFNFFKKTKKWLWVLWPTYGVVSLMTVSYLLGAREEYHNIMYRRYAHRHR